MGPSVYLGRIIKKTTDMTASSQICSIPEKLNTHLLVLCKISYDA